ncbi:hypothetical protein AB0B45_13675 [Nonomuraea sp. NPDC049152]|uniref:hypothetical protein n=1 Tax=Nonomuraea sp. NPDC049152 TaxID=3154350 RepID=UPI00340AAF81
MGVAVGAVMAAALLAATFSTRWVRSMPGPAPLGLVAAFRIARGNRAFFALLSAFVVQALGVAVTRWCWPPPGSSPSKGRRPSPALRWRG